MCGEAAASAVRGALGFAYPMAVETEEVADLYRRCAAAVHRRAFAILRDEEEAYDVTQETFVGYLRARPGLRGEAQPFTVLYQIATYQALDRLRRRARWSGVLRSIDVPDEEEKERPDPPHAVVDSDEARVGAAMDLAVLTRGEDKDVLTAAYLYFVEGYTTEEIAQAIDFSRKTVGRMLVRFADRARARLSRMERVGKP